MSKKFCPGCGKEISVQLFGVYRAQRDGLSRLCLKHTAELRRHYRKRELQNLQERLDKLRERERNAAS